MRARIWHLASTVLVPVLALACGSETVPDDNPAGGSGGVGGSSGAGGGIGGSGGATGGGGSGTGGISGSGGTATGGSGGVSGMGGTGATGGSGGISGSGGLGGSGGTGGTGGDMGGTGGIAGNAGTAGSGGDIGGAGGTGGTGGDAGTAGTGGGVAAIETCPGEAGTIDYGDDFIRTGELTQAVDDYSSFCGDLTASADNPDQVYAVTLAQDGTARFKLVSTGGGLNAAMYIQSTCGEGDAGAGRCFDAQAVTESFSDHLPAGLYYVIVDATAGTTGTYELSVSLDAPTCGDAILNPGEQCDPGAPTTNDGCTDPGSAGGGCQTEATPTILEQCPGSQKIIPLGVTTIAAQTTVGALDDYKGSCTSGTGGPDVVYQLVPQATGTLTATVGYETDGTTDSCGIAISNPYCFERVLYARSTCTDATTELDCSQAGSLTPETITFPVVANQAYAVIVDGYDNQSYSSGQFNLRIELTSP